MRAAEKALLFGLLFFCHANGNNAHATPSEEQSTAELRAAQRAKDVVVNRLSHRESELRNRVRTLYKLMRGGLAPLWVAPEARGMLVRVRGAAQRILLRDMRERQTLQDEVREAEENLTRLITNIVDWAAATSGPAPNTLRIPVTGRVQAGFGPYTDRRTKARLFRAGVEWSAPVGGPVYPVANGRVAEIATLRELGTTIVLDHGGFLSVLAGIGSLRVKKGDGVTTLHPLGQMGDRPLYLQIRWHGGPIDPDPLLSAAGPQAVAQPLKRRRPALSIP